MRVGLVGAGRHSREIIAPALSLAGIELVGIAARRTESAQSMAQLLGAVPAFAGAPSLIDTLRSSIDALVVVLPPDEGEDVVMAALEADLPVYTEKPLAMTSAALHRIEAVRAQRGGNVMVGYMKRFAPAYRRASALSQESEFGGISALHLQWSMGSRYDEAEYYLRENAVHMLDLARFLMGEVDEVTARRDSSGAGIAISVLARFDGGSIGTLQLDANGSFDQPGETLRLVGRSAAVAVENVEECRYSKAGQPARIWLPNHTIPAAGTSSLTTSGFVGALSHFGDTVMRKGRCEADLASAIATLELAERIAEQI